MTLTWNWPLSNIRTAHRLITLTFVQSYLKNPTRCSNDIERTRNTIILCLSPNNDLQVELIWVNHTHCITTYHTFVQSYLKSHQVFKINTQKTVILCLSLNYDLDMESTFVKHTHCTSTYHTWHLCGVFFSSPEHFVLKVSFCDGPLSVVYCLCVRVCVNNFIKQHLLWNHLLDFDQTSQEWSLGGPLSKLFKPFQLVA